MSDTSWGDERFAPSQEAAPVNHIPRKMFGDTGKDATQITIWNKESKDQSPTRQKWMMCQVQLRQLATSPNRQTDKTDISILVVEVHFGLPDNFLQNTTRGSGASFESLLPCNEEITLNHVSCPRSSNQNGVGAVSYLLHNINTTAICNQHNTIKSEREPVNHGSDCSPNQTQHAFLKGKSREIILQKPISELEKARFEKDTV